MEQRGKMKPSSRYPIPAERFRSELEVERSRFITSVQPVTCVAEAQLFIAEMKSEFADANHNCWAYLVGPPAGTDQIGMSDDGEPHGAAGKPMLTALQYSGLGDTAVVVSRYFGGIKLGKGGMVKAYTAAVKTALEAVPRRERVEWLFFQVAIDYSLVTLVQRQFEDFEVEVLDTRYAERVLYRLRMPAELHTPFRLSVDDLSAGQAEWGCEGD